MLMCTEQQNCIFSSVSCVVHCRLWVFFQRNMDTTDNRPFENTKQRAYEVHYYNELGKAETAWQFEQESKRMRHRFVVFPGFMVQKTSNPYSEQFHQACLHAQRFPINFHSRVKPLIWGGKF